MQARYALVTVLAPLALAAACGSDNDNTNPLPNATVRFVNATGTNLDVATNGIVGTGNGNLSYAGSSSCMTVNAANPGLAVNMAGTTTSVPGFTSNYASGGNYTVIAYPGAGGTTQFATLDNGSFTPTSGNGGLRVFNAASGAGGLDVYTMAPGGTLGTASATNVGYGTGSAYFNVPAGTQDVQLTNAGTQTVALDAGNSTFTSGMNSLLVVAPPATGTTALRAFSVSGC